MDAYGAQRCVKQVPGRISEHQALNEVIARAFKSAGIHKNPTAYQGQMARDQLV